MSFTLGIYDLYSYLVPGMLYLYVINEYLLHLGWKLFDLSSISQPNQSSSALLVITILLEAFIVGHLLEPIARKLLYEWIYREKIAEQSLASMKAAYPELNINFEPINYGFLLTIIRNRKMETVHVTEKFQANNIMFRNLAFGFLLLAGSELWYFIGKTDVIHLIGFVSAILLCWIAVNRSIKFRRWFLTNIYESALEFGSNLTEVIESSEYRQKQKASPAKKATNRSKKESE